MYLHVYIYVHVHVFSRIWHTHIHIQISVLLEEEFLHTHTGAPSIPVSHVGSRGGLKGTAAVETAQDELASELRALQDISQRERDITKDRTGAGPLDAEDQLVLCNAVQLS